MVSGRQRINDEEVAAYLRDIVEDRYVNTDGVWKQSRLFHIASVREIDDTDVPTVEVYRWFYNFERPVAEEEFLNLYYIFDDLGEINNLLAKILIFLLF